MAPKNRTRVKVAGAEFWPDDAGNEWPGEDDHRRVEFDAPPLEHDGGFRWIRVAGVCYRFDPLQSIVVRALWRTSLDGDGPTTERAILRRIGRSEGSIFALFNGHPAWKTLFGAARIEGELWYWLRLPVGGAAEW